MKLFQLLPEKIVHLTCNWPQVSAEINGKGSVAGVGSFQAGKRVTLSATPFPGNAFLAWRMDNAIKKETSITFSVTEDVTVEAYFLPTDILDRTTKTFIDTQIAAGELYTSSDVDIAIAEATPTIKAQAIVDALEKDEVYTKDEMQALAYGDPVIEVKDGVASVGIALEKSTALDGEWKAVEIASPTVKDGKVVVEVQPEEGETTAFYRFTVGDKDE